MRQHKIPRLNGTQATLLGFLAVILLGSGLLALPVSAADGHAVPYMDALFTATTSVCVTGLVTVPTFSTWSGFGQAVILLLIQIGGLGVITILSGVLITSRYCSAKTDYGTSYLMQSITAVVMGGTDINGGSGTVAGTILAVMILQTVSTGFTIHRVDQNLVNIFNGLILLAVLSIRYITGRVIATKKIRERQAEAKSQA